MAYITTALNFADYTGSSYEALCQPTVKTVRPFANSRGGDALRVDPRDIQIEAGYNCRNFAAADAEQDFQELKASIKENGVLQPLTVRVVNGYLTLTDGERRIRAVWELIAEGVEIRGVKIQSEDKGLDEAQRLVVQVASNTGRKFTPLELASAVAKLERYGWAREAIAKSLALGLSRVSQLIQLNGLSVALKEKVTSGQISASYAVELLAENDGDEEKVLGIIDKATNDTGEGKKKVTRKTVTGKTANAKLKTIKTLVGPIQVAEDSNTVKVPAVVWAKVREELGL